MNLIDRRKIILVYAIKEKSVLVDKLAHELGVSAVTIRSDLKFLDRKNLLIRTHGGAVLSNPLSRELSIDEKSNQQHSKKQKIAVAVKKLIYEGETVILDSGTTTAEIALLLRNYRNLTVMTNGLNVAQNLLGSKGIEIHLTGGKLRQKTLSFYGRSAEEQLSLLHFNKVILGVDGFDTTVGITTHFEHEASLNRAMCKTADQIIVATDSSKFDRSSVYKIANNVEIDILVTDNAIADNTAQSLEQAGINLIIAE